MSSLPSRIEVARGEAAGSDVPEIDDEGFQRFQDFFYRKTGIVFGGAKRGAVERRLAVRMAECGSASVRSYLARLRFEDSTGQELQSLVNGLTVNETYFYREEYQFRCLVRSILPELIGTRHGGNSAPIRIWSLPCSTGEEPYSLAIQMLDNWPDVDRFDVEIMGSDIDTRVLAQARTGLYDNRSVQHLSAPTKRRYFHQTADGRWQISEILRQSVDFGVINISDRAAMRRYYGAFDVIFCRNLLIYFDDVSRREAAEALFDALQPGGFLCLGHSESMSRISPLFAIRKFPDAIVYQKPQS